MEKLENLSIEEKVGQMLMVGLDGIRNLKQVKNLVKKYKITGVLLYKRDYKNYREMINLINEFRKLGRENKIPLFIAIDQEGGRVNRMPNEFKNLPPANTLAKEGLVEKASEITGKMLKNTGFNFNFAPVLDIKRFPDNHAIGDRAFSNSLEEVTKCGIEYINEIKKYNVVPVIKHYPGHGATAKDSHFSLPKIDKEKESLEKEDLIPFNKAIENGADALLVGHLRIKGVTHGLPATMSKSFIRKYIRKKNKFNGVIITDDVRMKAVKILYGKKKALEKAFIAGNDIVLFKYNLGDEKLIDKIINDVKIGKINIGKINRSVKRILKLKEKYQIENLEIPYLEDLPKDINFEIENIKNEKGESYE